MKFNKEVQELEKNKSRHSICWGPSSRKAAWHPGGPQAEHEPAVCPCEEGLLILQESMDLSLKNMRNLLILHPKRHI